MPPRQPFSVCKKVKRLPCHDDQGIIGTNQPPTFGDHQNCQAQARATYSKYLPCWSAAFCEQFCSLTNFSVGNEVFILNLIQGVDPATHLGVYMGIIVKISDAFIFIQN